MKRKRFAVLLLLPLLIACFLSVGSVSAQLVGSGSIDNSLAAYWRFDESSGFSAVDSSGNGNDLALTVELHPTGKYVNSLGFSGTSHIDATGLTDMPDGTGDFSYSFWIYLPNAESDGAGFFGILNSIAGYHRGIIQFNGHIYFWGAPDIDTSVDFDVGAWQNIIVTYDVSETTVTIYKNTNNIGSNSAETFTAEDDYNIAGRDGFFGHDGTFRIDDLRVYNRVLTPTEINTLYNGYTITASYDIGSTVSPNGTVMVGVDQSQAFVVGVVSTNFMQSSIYVDGVPYAPSSTFTLSGVQADHTVYVTSQFIGSNPTPTSNIDLPTIILLILTGFFVVLAFITKEPFLFGIAGLLSIIFGLYIGLQYLANTAEWIFGIVGFASIMFGAWLFVAVVQFSNKKGSISK